MTDVDWVIVKDLQGKIENYSVHDKNVEFIKVLKDKIVIKYNASNSKGSYKKVIILKNIASYESPYKKMKPLISLI
jgi:hypothetical protein